MKKVGKKLEENIKDIIVVFLMLIYKYMGCPIRFFTGVPCPGCGMTRAVIALLKFEPKAAYQYHPMIIIMPFIGLWCFVSSRLSKRMNYIITVMAAILLAVCYAERIIEGKIAVNISDGFIIKLITDMK